MAHHLSMGPGAVTLSYLCRLLLAWYNNNTAWRYLLADSTIYMYMRFVFVFSKIQDLEEELKVVCNTMKSLELFEQEVC